MAMQKATAVLGAPGAEAALVKKMMASRPTLNPNKRRAPRQDLSGAVNGALTGRGGNRQDLGTAAMRRLSAQQSGAPATTGAPEPIGKSVSAEPFTATSVDVPDAAAVANYWTPERMGAAGPPRGGRPEDMVADVMPGQGASVAGFGPSLSFSDKVGGAMRQPAQIPMGGQSPMDAALAGSNITLGKLPGAGPGAATEMAAAGVGGAQAPPGAAPPGMAAGVGGALAGAGGPRGGTPSGIPPAIMQRLSALRGAQPQGATGGGAPQMRGSFADFWARNSGGAATPY